jgi:Zn-dependent peptidase ImmA (M78 family)
MRNVVTWVDVQGEMLRWARERSGLRLADLARRFPKLADWESGSASPTLKQLEAFATATHTPIGFLFLPDPPAIQLPLPDFRTRGNLAVRDASPDLLDTIFQAQQREEWYEEYARTAGIEPRSFVGSMTPANPPGEAADLIRDALDFGVRQRGSTWDAAFRILTDSAERLGVLVMVSGVVGSNTHRKLNVEEFQGFALSNPYAPVVFVNGNDTRAAKIFTLTHELAHLWLGQSALDDADPAAQAPQEAERWCSQVAAIVLVPMLDLQARFQHGSDLTAQLDQLASDFKVSTLVVLHRLREAGYFGQAEFWEAYNAELARVRSFLAAEVRGGGGNFYNTQPARVSKRFARAVITTTLEGQTLYRDAFQMLGFRKVSAFNELARKLEVV